MKTWTVELRVFAFDTKRAAEAYEDALISAFCAMPESENYAAVSHILEEEIDEPHD